MEVDRDEVDWVLDIFRFGIYFVFNLGFIKDNNESN